MSRLRVNALPLVTKWAERVIRAGVLAPGKSAHTVNGPKKLAWRRMNRAIDLVIRKVSPGAEVWGLDDAARRIHKGLERLKPSSSHNFCDRCSHLKPVW